MVMFQEAGEFLGCYPIWRSSDQKPFSAEDARFVRAVAPDISHGLKAAQLLARGGSKPQGEDFWPLPGWGSGVLLVDQDGKLIAWDSVASLVLQQLCVLDGMAAIEFASRSVRDSLRYVVRMVYSIFHEGGASFAAGPPVSQMYFHWSGIVLRLRGVQMVGADGREYVTVLIERGETHESRRRRLIVTWGLTEREFDVLSLLAQGNTGPEISITLGITHDTTRKHASSIFEKLGVKNRTAAAAAMIHENN
jgi:DNA-binding CsgD family transcriptional regulator